MSGVDLRFTIETVTPLFLGGAEQQPQERAASLLPVMRWWFRALVGGLVVRDGFVDLDTVRRLDLATFGSTRWSRPARLELTRHQACTKSLDPDKYGVAYMLGPGLRPKARRQCFEPGSTFHLAISGLPRRLAPRWLASLWLLSTLGGLGARAHRCFGRIEITPCCDLDSLVPAGDGGIRWKDLFARLPRDDPARTLGQRLGAVQKIVHASLQEGRDRLGTENTDRGTDEPLPQFSILAPKWALLKILDCGQCKLNSWEAAVDFAGWEYRKAREAPQSTQTSIQFRGQCIHIRHSRDWPVVEQFWNPSSGVSGDPELHLLGLPVQFRRSRRDQAWSAQVVANSGEINRYSPVWWPVFRLGGSPPLYAVGLLIFLAAFLPKEIEIQMRGKIRMGDTVNTLTPRPVPKRDPVDVLKRLFDTVKGTDVSWTHVNEL